MRTAVAADEPDRRPPLATGGYITGHGFAFATDGCIWPNGPCTVVHPPGAVSITVSFNQPSDDETAAFLHLLRRRPGGGPS